MTNQQWEMHEEAVRKKAARAAKDARVSALVASGLSHAEVAERLNISKSAVVDAVRRAKR